MCEICRKSPCDYRCPNYEPPKVSCHCSICGAGIYDEEKYIETLDGYYIHYDCAFEIDELINFLGLEVKTMKSEND